jgi:7-carboxy-7-deazaguanine synthase
VSGHRLPLVEFTGGEPLLQAGSAEVMRALCNAGFTVLVETSGAHDIGTLDPRVRCIMDLKTPGSGEVARNRWENITRLKATDEVKFVIGSREDPSLKSPPASQPPISRQELVEANVADRLPVRFQLQMHKFIWPPDQKGV